MPQNDRHVVRIILRRTRPPFGVSTVHIIKAMVRQQSCAYSRLCFGTISKFFATGLCGWTHRPIQPPFSPVCAQTGGHFEA